jgi:hypothetical protein
LKGIALQTGMFAAIKAFHEKCLLVFVAKGFVMIGQCL